MLADIGFYAECGIGATMSNTGLCRMRFWRSIWSQSARGWITGSVWGQAGPTDHSVRRCAREAITAAESDSHSGVYGWRTLSPLLEDGHASLPRACARVSDVPFLPGGVWAGKRGKPASDDSGSTGMTTPEYLLIFALNIVLPATPVRRRRARDRRGAHRTIARWRVRLTCGSLRVQTAGRHVQRNLGRTEDDLPITL